MERKNFHEAFGIKCDPEGQGNDFVKDPLKLDCELDEIPSEITEKPPSSKKNAAPDDLESSVEDLDLEDFLTVSQHTLDVAHISVENFYFFFAERWVSKRRAYDG